MEGVPLLVAHVGNSELLVEQLGSKLPKARIADGVEMKTGFLVTLLNRGHGAYRKPSGSARLPSKW